jgi:hypothetical protein
MADDANPTQHHALQAPGAVPPTLAALLASSAYIVPLALSASTS